MTEQTYFATAPKGIESLLAAELSAFGASEVHETRAGVSFCGDLALAYRVCLWSRLANRVLLPLAHYPAPTPEALYEGALAVEWAAHLGPDDTLAVDAAAVQSAITHTQYAAQRIKDAIVDTMRERHGRRPSVERDRPALRVNMYVYRNEATLSLDLSGESLHRRGYRARGVAAPLKENVAAAMLVRAGWPEIAQRGGALLDPLCGSGTLLIEGALLAADIAPGLAREYYGFLGWRGHDAESWQALLEEARERRDAGIVNLPPLLGWDADDRAIDAARTNITHAGLDQYIQVKQQALANLHAKQMAPASTGLVAVNPPYGERLGNAATLQALYDTLGEKLRDLFTGWRAAVLTGEPELGKNIGIRARKKYSLYNGALACKLLVFEVEPQWFMGADRPDAIHSPATPPLSPVRKDRKSASAGEGSAWMDRLGPGAEMLANRLRKNLKTLGRWAQRNAVTCYRLYDADMPEYAFAIDLYQSEQQWHAHVQEYQAPKSVEEKNADARRRVALAVIPRALDIAPERVHFKLRQKQKGAAQYTRQAAAGRYFEVQENGLRLLVNFDDYLDTGLFLDHRLTRALLRELATRKRFLNLFAYTGTATVYAAAGGATTTTTVDMSRTYLDWTRRNMHLNGYTGTQHRYVQADCLQWLADAADKHDRFDLIFLDPPTFSNSARMRGTLDIQRDHVTLLNQAARLLTPDGVLIFSNNYRGFKIDSEALAEWNIENISRTTLPQDYARNPRIHHCFRISRTPM